jgi:cellobionic acid phosphorylase
MIAAVDQQLETPHGVMLVAPAFTAMREDIGRVTQKFPGSAENGSVYNHAAAFYIYSLFTAGESDRAYRLMRRMIPGPDMADYKQRGQLPVYIPNYYRGAYYQHTRTAGRSSQLFNTGTVSWVYRCLIEQLFGLRGDRNGLLVQPQLPTGWQSVKVRREFRDATFEVAIRREPGNRKTRVNVDGALLPENRITNIQPGRTYRVDVVLPAS